MYSPLAAAITQGHLDQQKINTRPTTPPTAKPAPPKIITTPPITNNKCQLSTPPDIHTETIYTQCISVTRKVLTYKTRQFPHHSTAVNTDMIVLYCFYANHIHIKVMPSRLVLHLETAAAVTAAFTCSWMKRPCDDVGLCIAAATAAANTVGVVRIDCSDVG